MVPAICARGSKCYKGGSMARGVIRGRKPFPQSKRCDWCGDTFICYRSDARTCSGKCRIAWMRGVNKERGKGK